MNGDLGLGEGLVRIAVPMSPGEGDVVGNVVVDLRSARLNRLDRIDDRVQWLVVNLDQIEGIARDVGTLGHHDRERLSDVADPLGRERIGHHWLHSTQAPAAFAPAEGHRPRQRLEVVAGQDRDHAG